MEDNKKITVTQPFLPPLEEFTPYLKTIWDNKQVTNNGPYHKKLEDKLCEYLGVKHISLFANGTIALLVAIKALELKGEIITTPFSFVATAHAIKWNEINPVFIDIEQSTCNINPKLIEGAITDKTTAILPVHVYGNPCNTEEIGRIANKNNLKIIYDAAHSFGVKVDGNSIFNYGDLSVLSFHATKVFNTFEGGAIVCHTAQMKKRIDDLKNFGFQNQILVEGIGINGKMNELQAAMGLLQLKYIDRAIQKRKEIAQIYRMELTRIDGVNFLAEYESRTDNYAYFPVFINEHEFGMSRDDLYEKLINHNIFCRQYFYPLIPDFSVYNQISSRVNQKLSVAESMSEKVLCLPIYPDLEFKDVTRIIEVLKKV
jgi:dTDP-4-amino-4,6-dideoxygalactose transaminase